MSILHSRSAWSLTCGVVRDYEAISHQFALTFFTSHKPSQIDETRMYYTMCTDNDTWVFIQYKTISFS